MYNSMVFAKRSMESFQAKEISAKDQKSRLGRSLPRAGRTEISLDSMSIFKRPLHPKLGAAHHYCTNF